MVEEICHLGLAGTDRDMLAPRKLTEISWPLAGNFYLKPRIGNQTMKPIQPIYLLAVFLANAALSLWMCAVTLHFSHRFLAAENPTR